MTLGQIWDNPLTFVDCYYLSTGEQKENVDFEVSQFYNRERGMILYGLNELTLWVVNRKIEENMVMDAEQQANKMGLRFPTELWMRVVNELKGRIPLRIQAMRDGMWCPKGMPFCQIYNTEEGFGEISSWYEAVLMKAFFPSGCATRAFEMREYLDSKKLPSNRIHSFAYRSYKSQEDAYWGGTAYSLSLPGTDDFGVKQHLPNANIGSIQASAHKVVQQFDKEIDAYMKSVDVCWKNTPSGKFAICAFPIDTYDPHKFIYEYSVRVARYAVEKGVHIVFRPDSGDVINQAVELYNMMKVFGSSHYTSVIIGEGITFDKIKEYDKYLGLKGVPLDYVSYGIGGGFHKDIDRDWLGWAMKTSFSNHKPRMKFSADSIKKSIPGQVNIKNDPYEEGRMYVDYTRDGLYYDIYFYDNRTDRPYTTPMSWDEIKVNVDKNRGKVLQKEILLSPSVLDEIEKLRKIYL